MFQFAIIGCGRIGRHHALALDADGRGRAAALFDVDREAAERLQRDCVPQAEIHSDLESLLDEAAVDAVIICSPTSAHFDHVMAGWERGLPILCEKPLADTRERIVELIEKAARGAPPLAVAYQRRYSSIYRTLRRELQADRWGPIRAVTAQLVEDWQSTIGETWRDDPAHNLGGFVGDAGSHKIDVVFYVTGRKPVEVFAQCDCCGSRVEIATAVCGRLEGRVSLGMNFLGHAHHLGEDFHITCDEADLLVRDERLWIARNNRVEPFPETEMEPDSTPVSGFIDLLEEGRPNPAPPDCALPVFDFTQAILESSRTNRLVRL
ncbi:MAG: Gfo/Idh/MocA family oxidoreductase [Planctomycetes bacterium]|nr:Gfo/Idh/MocA family oxidoreductase [Planctomycetota bacterium]